jgi:hypothetical protein
MEDLKINHTTKTEEKLKKDTIDTTLMIEITLMTETTLITIDTIETELKELFKDPKPMEEIF